MDSGSLPERFNNGLKLKSSSNHLSPQSSHSGDLDEEACLEQKQRDTAKRFWPYQAVAVTILIGIFCLSGVVVITNSGKPIRPEALRILRMNSTSHHLNSSNHHHNRSSRKFADFFPCEDAGLADPMCASDTPFTEKPKREIDRLQSFAYISKNDPPPGYEKWLQFAQDNRCHLGSYSRIEKDLEAFTDSTTGKRRILKHHVEGAKKLPATAVFTVKDGILTITGENVPGLMLQERIQSMMARYVQDLPDLEFVVNINDQPRVIPGHAKDRDVRLAGRLCQNASESFQKHRHLHGYINNRRPGPEDQPTSELVALFSQAKINECHRDIMYPSVYTYANQVYPHEHPQLKAWHERDEIMFFRGSSTGGIFNNLSTFAINHRHRLVELAKNRTDLDIEFTDIIQCSEEVCKAMEQQYGHVPRVPEMQNFDHKYLISIDGNSFVARLPKFLQSGSLIFRAGMFDEWFEEWMQEGVHYVRVALDYSDLFQKIQWAKDHDAEARKIALEGRYFGVNHIRTQDMECYLYRLLLEYAAIQEL